MPGPRHLQTCLADYLELLKVFNEQGVEAVIVGGQAVNLWAEVFRGEEPEIEQYSPFTSADLDLHRPGLPAVRLLRAEAGEIEHQRDPFGKAFTLVSHTFLVESQEGKMLAIDSLKMVLGLRPEEVQRATVAVEFRGVTVRVLNPIACLKGKIYNVSTLDQQGRQDAKHVRILILCTRTFVGRLLREAVETGNYRPVLDALEDVIRTTSQRAVIRTAQDMGLSLLQALPVADLAQSPHPKITNFMTKRFSNWQQLWLTEAGPPPGGSPPGSVSS